MCYAATNNIWGQRKASLVWKSLPCQWLTNLLCHPARPGHLGGSERLSQFHACPVAPHRQGDSVGLCKRDEFNLFLAPFLHKHLVIREKSPFRTRGRGIYANSPACYRNRRRPRKAEGWEQHLLRKVVKQGQRARGDSGAGGDSDEPRVALAPGTTPAAPSGPARWRCPPPAGGAAEPGAADSCPGAEGSRPGAAGSCPETAGLCPGALVPALPRAPTTCRALVRGKGARRRGLCLPRRFTLVGESSPGAGRAEEDDLPCRKLFRV